MTEPAACAAAVTIHAKDAGNEHLTVTIEIEPAKIPAEVRAPTGFFNFKLVLREGARAGMPANLPRTAAASS